MLRDRPVRLPRDRPGRQSGKCKSTGWALPSYFTGPIIHDNAYGPGVVTSPSRRQYVLRHLHMRYRPLTAEACCMQTRVRANGWSDTVGVSLMGMQDLTFKADLFGILLRTSPSSLSQTMKHPSSFTNLPHAGGKNWIRAVQTIEEEVVKSEGFHYAEDGEPRVKSLVNIASFTVNGGRCAEILT